MKANKKYRVNNEVRIFGNLSDTKFWSDKPIQKWHPKYKEKTKWYHIHWYNKTYNSVHKSPNGEFTEVMKVTMYKCNCGKLKP